MTTPLTEHLMAVRAWTRRQQAKSRQSRRKLAEPISDHSVVLVLDAETTTDPSQRLLFGSYQVYARPTFDNELSGPVAWRDYRLVEEGLFYGDDLPERDPQGWATLQDYCRKQPGLHLRSRAEFVKRVFYPLAYEARALVVGFNLPFDLSRPALQVGTARKRMAGGCSFMLSGDYSWPRARIKSLDSKRALLDFNAPKAVDETDTIPQRGAAPNPRFRFQGSFLDLRTLAFALTNASHSLKSAGQAFGVAQGKGETEQHGVITPGYIDYNRQDVRATWALYTKLRTEYERHPVDLPITKALSPAAIGKAYLRAMGITPPLEQHPNFPPAVLGRAMAAYYGGRAEARVRHLPVPVVYVDFLSMYPTVNALMENWRLLTAEQITVEDVTKEVQELVAHVTAHDLFRPALWRRLAVLVQVAPDGDILPARMRYGESNDWQIGVNPLTSQTPLWYTLADVVAAKLLTGKAPQVLHAQRLVPHGRQPGLQPLSLRGDMSVDPAQQDFFRQVVELRKQTTDLTQADFLKVLANAASYGIFAEMNPQEQPSGKTAAVDVWGVRHFSAEVHRLEQPGVWAFPPLAAFIAGGARLMLALLERSVTDLGGTYAFCDTDSLAIVATEHGGLVPCPGGTHADGGAPAVKALSWAEVQQLVDRFAALTPYDQAVVPGSILQLEDENYDTDTHERRQLYCLAISAKRYALYNLDAAGRPVLRKWSEHGLGHLLNPEGPSDQPSKRWIKQVWEYLLAPFHGQTPEPLPWADLPALSRFTVSTPTLLKYFEGWNEGQAYADQIKPFNFVVLAHAASLGPNRQTLIAPYETDPKKWLDLDWTDVRTQTRHQITTGESFGGTTRVRVKTYGDVVGLYRVHPETKFLGPEGEPCGRTTSGLLRRQPVLTQGIIHIGKEANRVEEVKVGLIQDPEAVYTFYVDAWDSIRRVLQADLSTAQAAQLVGRSERTIRNWRVGQTQPRGPSLVEVIQKVAAWIREQLAVSNPKVARWSDLEALAAWESRPG
ncbi:MAG: hypothetical protein CL878_13600 [Dehalococcoidia bacterium]|nr:hypothetical protein [Dehalococcoidia bacterium]